MTIIDMDNPEKQESKASILLRYTEELCKKHGFKHTIRKPNKDVFTVSFKKKRET